MKTIKLLGGYFDGMVYGMFEVLPAEILLHYYVNPRAEMQGVTILGITEKGPDDITKVLRYVLFRESSNVAYYNLKEEVDPGTVVKNEETGELERKESE